MRGVALQILLLIGLSLLLMLNGAVLLQSLSGHSPQRASAAALAQIDQQFRATAAGGSLMLHLPGYDLNDPGQATRAGGLYFRANYVLFPQRAYVGDRQRVINMASQLIPGDDEPSPAWIAAHGVRGGCVFPGPAASR